MRASIKRGAATVLNAMRDNDHRWFYMTDEMQGEGVQGVIVAVYGERAEDFLRAVKEWEAAPAAPKAPERDPRGNSMSGMGDEMARVALRAPERCARCGDTREVGIPGYWGSQPCPSCAGVGERWNSGARCPRCGGGGYVLDPTVNPVGCPRCAP